MYDGPVRRYLEVAALAALLALAGCRKAGAELQGELLYVDEVEAPSRAPSGRDVVVEIRGNMPDPSWQWLRNDVKVEGSTVTVDVLGIKVGKGPVAMVLVPFVTTATLSALPVGRLTLVVRGRGRDISKPLEITPD